MGAKQRVCQTLLLTLAFIVLASFAGLSPTFSQLASQAQAAPGGTSARSFSATSKSVQSTWVQRLAISGDRDDGKLIVTKEAGKLAGGKWAPLTGPLPFGGGEVTYRYKFEYSPHVDSNYEGRIIFTPEFYDKSDNKYSAAQMTGQYTANERYDFSKALPKISDEGCGSVDLDSGFKTGDYNKGEITGFSEENGWLRVDPSESFVANDRTFRTGGWAISADPTRKIIPYSGDASPAYLYCTTNVTKTTTAALTVENMLYTAISEYKYPFKGYKRKDFLGDQSYLEALNGEWTWWTTTGNTPTVKRGRYPLRVPLTVEVEDEPLPDVDSRISVTKTPDKPAIPQGGDEVTYTYEVKNNIPARFGERGRMFFENISDDKCPQVGATSGLQAYGTRHYIPPEGTAVFSCKMQVTSQLTNTVTAKFRNNDDQQTSTATAHATVRIQERNLPDPQKRIRLDITPNPTLVNPGENVVYTYRVTSLISEYMIEDRKRLYFSELTDPSCTSINYQQGGQQDGAVRYLDPGETMEFTCTRPIADGDAGKTLTNTATAKFTSKYDNKEAVAANSSTIRVRPKLPDPADRVSVTKEPNVTWLPYGGGEVRYRYQVSNLIPEDYSDSELGKMYIDELSDDKCSPVKLVSEVGTQLVNGAERKLLYPGESATYECVANLAATTTNTATFTATNAGDNQQSIKTADATVEVSTNPNYPDKSRWARLEMTPSVEELPNGGGEVTYTYTLTNMIPKKTVKGEDYGRLYLENASDDVCSSAASELRAKLTKDTENKHPDGRQFYLPAGESVTFTCKTNITETVTNTIKVQLSNIDPNVTARKAPLLEQSATVTVMPPIPAPEQRISVEKTAFERNANGDIVPSDGEVFFDDFVRYDVKVKNNIPVEFAGRQEGKMYLVDQGVSDPLCSLAAPNDLKQDGNGKYLVPNQEATWSCLHKIVDEQTENTATASFKQIVDNQVSTVKSNTVTISAKERPVPGRIGCSEIVTGSDSRREGYYDNYGYFRQKYLGGKLELVKNIVADRNNPQASTFDKEDLNNGDMPDFGNNRGGTAAVAVNPRSSNEVFYSIRNLAGGGTAQNGIYKFDNATGTHEQMVGPDQASSMVRLGFDADHTLWTLDNNAQIYSYKFQVDAEGNTIKDGMVREYHGTFKLPAGHGNFAQKGSGDLAFDGLGNMWVITSVVGGGNGPGELYVVPRSQLVDDNSGANEGAVAVFVGEMGPHEYVGLAFDEKGNLWATDSRQRDAYNYTDNSSHLYLVDTGTGVATDVGEVGTNIHDLASCALPKPELRIDKKASPSGGPIPGEEITYEITIENVGNLHAIDMRFKDLMPADATYVPGSMEMTVGKTDAAGNLLEPTEVVWKKLPDNSDGTTYFHEPKLIKSPSVTNEGVIDYQKPGEQQAPPPIIIRFKVKPDYPQKASTNKQVCNQAQGTFVGKVAQLSDDPSKPGFADSSCTLVVEPNVGIDKKAVSVSESGESAVKTNVARAGEEVTYEYTVTTNPTQQKFNNAKTDQPKGLPEEPRFNKTLDVAEGQAAEKKLPVTSVTRVPANSPLKEEHWQSLVGTEPLKDVTVTDDKCVDDKGASAVRPVTKTVAEREEDGSPKVDGQGKPITKEVNIGDVNEDGLLDGPNGDLPGEAWKYTCSANIYGPTENIARVEAKGNRSEHRVNDTDKWFISSPEFKIQKLAAAAATEEDVKARTAKKVGERIWKPIGDPVRPDAQGKGTAVYQITVTNISEFAGSGDVVVDLPTPPAGVEVANVRYRLAGDTQGEPVEWPKDGQGKYIFSAPKLEAGGTYTIEALIDYKIADLASVKWEDLKTCQAASGANPSKGLFNKVEMTADKDGTDNNEACIPIVPPKVDFRVHKFARNCDTDKPTCDLQGAEFVIYDSEPTAGGGFKEVCVPDPDGATAAGSLPKQICSFLDNTVEDPSAPGRKITGSMFKSVPLEYNKSYWLLERQAPAGFTLLPRPIEFRITPDDPKTQADESGVKLWNGDRPADDPLGKEGDLLTVTDFSEKVPKVNEQGEPVLDEAGKQILEEKVSKGVQLNIENTSAKAVLPKSGSRGFYPYLAAGAALLIAAGLILNKDKLKKRFKR